MRISGAGSTALATSVVVLAATACDPGEDKLVMDAAAGSIDITWSTNRADAEPDADASVADASADSTNDGHVHGDRWGRGDVVEREWGVDPSSGGDDASVDGGSSDSTTADGATTDVPVGPKLALGSLLSEACRLCVRLRHVPNGSTVDDTKPDNFPSGFCGLYAGQTLKAGPPFNSADRGQACQDLLDCAARTACVPPGKDIAAVAQNLTLNRQFVSTCYCGNKSPISCLIPKNHDGVCATEIEMAFESTDPSAILPYMSDTTTTGGVVLTYLYEGTSPDQTPNAPSCMSVCVPELTPASDAGAKAGP